MMLSSLLGTVQPVVNALYPTFTAIVLLNIYGGCAPRTIKNGPNRES